MDEILKGYVKRDPIGVEMAQRKVVFHADETWDEISLY